jgi:hypothetical protein
MTAAPKPDRTRPRGQTTLQPECGAGEQIMNDNELSMAVRESVVDVHSPPPIARIISRGRAVRARRRITGVAGAPALAAGTALAVRQLTRRQP